MREITASIRFASRVLAPPGARDGERLTNAGLNEGQPLCSTGSGSLGTQHSC
jgi:hypothetical protein